MKASREYLEEALATLGDVSDSEKARQLKIDRSTLSLYRSDNRKMDDFACIMVARVLGIDPMKIIAACQEEREKSEERREFWRDFRNTLGGWIAVTLVFLTLQVGTATPAQASALAVDKPTDTLFIMSNYIPEFGATTPLFSTFSALAWKAGKAPVSVVCVKYLELLDSNELRCAGVWNGASAEGSRLIVPAGYQVTIDYANRPDRAPDDRA